MEKLFYAKSIAILRESAGSGSASLAGIDFNYYNSKTYFISKEALEGAFEKNNQYRYEPAFPDMMRT